MAELEAVLHYPEVHKKLPQKPGIYLAFIRRLAEEAKGQAFTGAPDPKDDYLIGLCLATGSSLATNNRLLYEWNDAPVRILRSSDFYDKYPLTE